MVYAIKQYDESVSLEVIVLRVRPGGSHARLGLCGEVKEGFFSRTDYESTASNFQIIKHFVI